MQFNIASRGISPVPRQPDVIRREYIAIYRSLIHDRRMALSGSIGFSE